MNLYICAGRLAEAEMRPQIVLREVTTAAPNFVHLAASFSGRAVYPCPDTRAIRLHSNGLHLEPVILRRLVATQELRNVIDAVHEHINVAVVVEIAEGAATPGDLFQNTSPAA